MDHSLLVVFDFMMTNSLFKFDRNYSNSKGSVELKIFLRPLFSCCIYWFVLIDSSVGWLIHLGYCAMYLISVSVPALALREYVVSC